MQPPETDHPPEMDEDEEAPRSGLGTVELALGAIIFGMVGAAAVAAFFFLALPALLPGGVIVAKRDFAPGEVLAAQDLEGVPMADAPPGAFRDAERVAGRVATSWILEGDVVLDPRLAPPGRAEGAGALVSKGRRAIWLAEGDGLGLRSGDHIDIWATTQEPGEPLETLQVARGVPVAHYEAGTPLKPARLTLAASPGQADGVTIGRSAGMLHVVLRSDLDHPVEDPPADLVPAAAAPGSHAAVHTARSVVPGRALTTADLVIRDGSGKGDAGFRTVEGLIGRVPHSLLYPGEKVVEARLADPAEGRGLASLLTTGEVAVALAVGANPLEMFEPGTTLDLLKVDPEAPQSVQEPVQEGASVLGVQREGETCPCVVFRISPDKVAAVLQARFTGTLGLAFPDEDGEDEG